MAYASGGTIEATHYNTFLNGTNQLNTVWSTGDGATGYGQSALSTVSASGSVTATQWATLINTLNNTRTHQSGSGSGMSAPTAGATINYLSAMQTQVDAAYTNRAAYATQGSTATGSNYDAVISTSSGISIGVAQGQRTVTFASANHARYFFNAGGQLNYYVSTPTGAGSGSQESLRRLIGGLGGWGQLNTTSTGRFGSGLTLNTNSTTVGYRNNLYNSATHVVQVTDTTGAYTSDYAYIDVYTTSNDTTNGSNGLTVSFYSLFYIGDKTWDDSISVTLRTRVDIVYPESTYLTSTWGTPVVS